MLVCWVGIGGSVVVSASPCKRINVCVLFTPCVVDTTLSVVGLIDHCSICLHDFQVKFIPSFLEDGEL